jgi:hypothetical protein
MALPIGGKIRQQFSWVMLRTLAQAIELPEQLAADVIQLTPASAISSPPADQA